MMSSGVVWPVVTILEGGGATELSTLVLALRGNFLRFGGSEWAGSFFFSCCSFNMGERPRVFADHSTFIIPRRQHNGIGYDIWLQQTDLYRYGIKMGGGSIQVANL